MANRQHTRRSRAGLPRRRVDRLGDLLAWLTAVLGLGSVLAAVVVGVFVHGDVVERARTETVGRTEVTAVVTESALFSAGPGTTWVTVPVRWTSADGAVHEATAVEPAPVLAGTPVAVWVDGAGAVVPTPVQADDATPVAITAGFSVLVFGVAAVLLLHRLLDGVLLRMAGREWDREWRSVGPRWTGRAGGRTG
ncbi:Rv1733c family protein [Pseudonocardia xishanensis]|uniref:DUF3592 domain-containing protein n=1 Tax=Pseudonocardia xishanensis TaxID=630995 RepID=A0ABP8RXJ2_9PSEU